MCIFVQKRLLFNLFFVLLQLVRGEIRTNDALLNVTHLTEGVWKTQFGIVRSLSRGGQELVSQRTHHSFAHALACCILMCVQGVPFSRHRPLG